MNVRRWLGDWVEDGALVTGAGLAAYGMHLVYHPLGYITAGVLLMVGTIYRARGAG